MTPEDKEQIVPIIELAVTRGVAAGVAPLWEKINKHSEDIARLRQVNDDEDAADRFKEIAPCIAHGKRLVKVETQQLVLETKIAAHVWWILGICGLIGGLGTALIVLWVNKMP